MDDSKVERTLAGVVAGHFRARPGRWIDGREIAQIAGCYGWRTRISDARRPPHNLNIRNRQRRVRTADGQVFTVSEYKLVTDEVRSGEGARCSGHVALNEETEAPRLF